MIARYDDEALDEALAAAKWYGDQQEGLVTRFLLKWKAAEGRILADPAIKRVFDPKKSSAKVPF